MVQCSPNCMLPLPDFSPASTDGAVNCNVQISDFETENDCTLPALLHVNGGVTSIWLHYLVTFTGKRFLRSTNQLDCGQGNVTSPGGKRTLRSRAQDSPGLLEADTSTARHKHEVRVPNDQVAIATLVFGLMQGNAPTSLSISELEQIFDVCQYYMADILVEGMGEYLKPLVQQVFCSEVRSRHSIECWCTDVHIWGALQNCKLLFAC
jgi:hypothetical protein